MRLIDADKLVENIEGITWYSTNKDGVIHKGAANREESYYRGSEIWEAIEKAPTCDPSKLTANEIINAIAVLTEEPEGLSCADGQYQCGYLKAMSIILGKLIELKERYGE